MNRNQRRAQRATWRVFADTVAETVGFATPLHKAAQDAANGAVGAGERFYELLDGLPVATTAKLLARLRELEEKKETVARQYVRSGRA